MYLGYRILLPQKTQKKRKSIKEKRAQKKKTPKPIPHTPSLTYPPQPSKQKNKNNNEHLTTSPSMANPDSKTQPGSQSLPWAIPNSAS